MCWPPGTSGVRWMTRCAACYTTKQKAQPRDTQRSVCEDTVTPCSLVDLLPFLIFHSSTSPCFTLFRISTFIISLSSLVLVVSLCWCSAFTVALKRALPGQCVLSLAPCVSYRLPCSRHDTQCHLPLQMTTLRFKTMAYKCP
jgi:hypothetical protein